MANILITGGSRGIGAAIVRRLAREGHRICFIYKESIETAHSLMRVLKAEGCEVICVQCDVRQPECRKLSTPCTKNGVASMC